MARYYVEHATEHLPWSTAENTTPENVIDAARLVMELDRMLQGMDAESVRVTYVDTELAYSADVTGDVLRALADMCLDAYGEVPDWLERYAPPEIAAEMATKRTKTAAADDKVYEGRLYEEMTGMKI